MIGFVVIKFHYNNIVISLTVGRIVHHRCSVERRSFRIHGIHSRSLSIVLSPFSCFGVIARQWQHQVPRDCVWPTVLVFHVPQQYFFLKEGISSSYRKLQKLNGRQGHTSIILGHPGKNPQVMTRQSGCNMVPLSQRPKANDLEYPLAVILFAQKPLSRSIKFGQTNIQFI